MRRVVLSLTLALAACSHDWESLDPRGAASGASGGASGSGGAASAGSSSSATSGSGASGAAGPGGGAGTGGTAGSSQGGAATGAGGAGGEGGSVPVTMAFAPTVAECVSTTAPDPVECETKTGMGLMNVDLSDPMMLERRSFLRFEIDAQLAEAPVDTIVLQLTTGPGSATSSIQAGEVYEVETFTLADLTGTVPATVGPVLAASPGAVAVAAQASWTLPSDLLAGSGGVLCLGVLPLVTDGADYFNLDGTTPPALVVTFH